MSGKRKTKPRVASSKLCGADQVVGAAADLPIADLPLVRDVLAKAKHIKDSLTQVGSGKDVSKKEIIEKLYIDVVAVYKKANSNLVLVSEKYGKKILEDMYTEYKNLARSGGSITSPKIVNFQKKSEKLCDIIFCKCKIENCLEVACGGCKDSAHVKCKCVQEKKIPDYELSYVMDQRMRQGGKGHMQMGKLDKKVTAEMQEALDLEESGDEDADNEENNNTPVADEEEVAVDITQEGLSDEEEFIDDSDDEDFVPVSENVPKSHEQNRMILRNLARECMRWGVSPKAGASIANATLIDAEVMTKLKKKIIIDKNKLKRQMKNYQDEIREK